VKNISRILLLIIIASVWLFPTAVFSQVEWESEIKVSAGHVESRLAIGQRADATDQRDGRYDVPPMLAGSLRAWLTGSGTSLWRDIRSPDTVEGKDWNLVVNNNSVEPVTILWLPDALPVDAVMTMTDPASGATVDMKKNNSYTMGDPAGGEVLIRLTF
jgi:hypothetical protein